jgi:hypothetical protein
MNNIPRQKLHELITQHSHLICDDHKKCEAMLRDLCPEYNREINILITALREKVAADLLTVSDATPKELLLANLTKRLHDNFGFGEEFASWAVESWAFALGVTAMPKQATQKTTTPNPPLTTKRTATTQPPKTHHDRKWWNKLDNKWKSIFTNAIGINHEPNDKELAKIVNLQNLLCRTTQISSLEPLSHLTNLQQLDCVDNQISSLEPLSHLTNLQKLYCWGNQISSLEPLSHLTNLQELSCGTNQISSLERIGHLTNLQTLYCGDNQINSLAPLSHLTNLHTLSCNGNKISSLKPLHNLKNLRHLNCRDTQISKSEIRKFKRAVPECYYINHSYRTLWFW